MFLLESGVSRGDEMFMCRIVVMLFVTVIAVIGDFKEYKIKNRFVLGVAVISVVLLVCEVLSGEHCEMYMKGGVAGFVISFAAYAVRGIGAGDAKFMAVLGSLVGLELILKIMTGAFVCGAVIGVCNVLVTGEKRIVQIGGMHKKEFHVFHFSLAIMIAELCSIIGMTVNWI